MRFHKRGPSPHPFFLISSEAATDERLTIHDMGLLYWLACYPGSEISGDDLPKGSGVAATRLIEYGYIEIRKAKGGVETLDLCLRSTGKVDKTPSEVPTAVLKAAMAWGKANGRPLVGVDRYALTELYRADKGHDAWHWTEKKVGDLLGWVENTKDITYFSWKRLLQYAVEWGTDPDEDKKKGRADFDPLA